MKEKEKTSNSAKQPANAESNSTSSMTPKRIAAIICIILLVGMYLATLIVAIFDRSESGRLFYICMISTAVLPLLTWIYIWLYGKMTNKHTIADFDIGKTGPNRPSEKDK